MAPESQIAANLSHLSFIDGNLILLLWATQIFFSNRMSREVADIGMDILTDKLSIVITETKQSFPPENNFSFSLWYIYSSWQFKRTDARAKIIF